MSLELAVTREQVTSFLRNEFEDYMEDSQSEGPTWGVDNYACNILDITQQVRSLVWIPFPNDVKDYFKRLTLTGIEFELSLLGTLLVHIDILKMLTLIMTLYVQLLKDIGKELF